MFMHHDDDGSEDHSGPDRYKTGQVHARLKHLLVCQHVPPHVKLDAGVLAARLKVSKTPVREALILLASEDIIFNIPGSGYFSKPLNVDELAEDYDFALTVLKHVIDADVNGLHLGRSIVPAFPNIDALSSDGAKVEAFKAFIEGLYEAIARTAPNKKYLHFVHTFNSRTTFVRKLDLERDDRFDHITAEMGELVDCLGRKNADGAIANLNRQFKRKIELLYDLVRQGNSHTSRTSTNWLQMLE